MFLDGIIVHGTQIESVNYAVEERVLSLSCHVPKEESQDFQETVERIASINNLQVPSQVSREPKLRYDQEFVSSSSDVQLFVIPDANSDPSDDMVVTTMPIAKLIEEAKKYRDKVHYFVTQNVHIFRLNETVNVDSLVTMTRNHLTRFCTGR